MSTNGMMAFFGRFLLDSKSENSDYLLIGRKKPYCEVDYYCLETKKEQNLTEEEEKKNKIKNPIVST